VRWSDILDDQRSLMLPRETGNPGCLDRFYILSHNTEEIAPTNGNESKVDLCGEKHWRCLVLEKQDVQEVQSWARIRSFLLHFQRRARERCT
jgi:hypothetical protein